MIQIPLQICPDYSMVPATIEAMEQIKNYKPNQIVQAKISGIQKQRSVRQLRLFWACCRTVSDNTRDEQWNNPEKVSIQVKLALKFFKAVVVAPDGHIHFELDSISFKNLRQIEANKIFDRSWPVMAGHIGVSVDDLLRNSEG